MTSIDVAIEQDDFSNGMVRSVAPALIPENGVYDLQDWMLSDDDGSVFWRGGNTDYSDASFGSGLRWNWSGYLTPGPREVFANADNFGVLDGTTPVNLGSDGLNYPTTAAEIEGLLFIGGGYIYGGSLKAANYSTGTISVTNGSRTVTGSGTTWNTLVDAGMLMQRGNERVYVIESIDSTTQVTLRDAYEGATGAGASYTFNSFYKITTADPYVASDCYAVSTGRLLWHNERRVYFTPLRTTAPQTNPHTFNATDYHQVPTGVRILGIAPIGQIVLVFTTGGVWRIGGISYDIVSEGGDPQHSFELLSHDYVLLNPAGISSWEQYLVVPCTDGIHLIDGTSQPRRISANIDPMLQDYIRLGYRVGGADIYKNRYFLPVLGGSEGVKDTLVCRLDRAVQDRRRRTAFPWSRLASSGGRMASYAVQNSVDPREPKLLGAEWGSRARVSDCSGYFVRTEDNKTDADGEIPWPSMTFRDFRTGGDTLNNVRKFRLTYEMAADEGDDPHLILDYGNGTRKPDTAAWGDPAGEWGVGFGPSGTSPWTEGEEGEFTPILRSGTRDYAPVSEIEPHLFRINKRTRVARFKLRAENDPATATVIRRAALTIRPSQAVRR